MLHFIFCLFTYDSRTLSYGSLEKPKPTCQTRCGNIEVPYPFGIGKDTRCSLDSSFYLNCNMSFDPPKLYLASSNLEIHSISDSELRIFTGVGYRCYDQYGNVSDEYNWWSRLRVFTFSEKNKFTVIGCDDIALITGTERDHYSSGCFGLCSNSSNVTAGECSGNGCCQTSMTRGLQFYNVTLNSLRSHTDVWSINKCGYAFLGEESTFRFGGATDLSNSSGLIQRVESSVLVVVDWAIGRYSRNYYQETECKENSECYDVDGGGYRCRCNPGYEGNPYHNQGCQDINECEEELRSDNPCYGNCINTIGSYNRTCPPGSFGNAKIPNNCTCLPGSFGDPNTLHGCQRFPAKDSKFTTIIFTLGAVLGKGILVFTVCMYKLIQKKKDKKCKENFCKRNGGLLFEQQTSNGERASETTRLFSAIELGKATDQYNVGGFVPRRVKIINLQKQ